MRRSGTPCEETATIYNAARLKKLVSRIADESLAHDCRRTACLRDSRLGLRAEQVSPEPTRPGAAHYDWRQRVSVARGTRPGPARRCASRVRLAPGQPEWCLG